MVKRVTLIVNYNLYESKRHFALKLAEAMQRKGIETQIVDTQERSIDSSLIKEIRAFDPDFTCSFNTIRPLPDQVFLWDLLKIPHVSFLLDPALYSTNLTRSPYSILTCIDRSDPPAFQAMGFKRIFFWPHAIEKDIHWDPKAKSRYEVIFLGSCYDYESLRKAWQKENKKEWSLALDDAIDIVLTENYRSLAEVLVTAWNARKLSLEGVDFMKMFYYLDNYLKGRDRVELIRSIDDVPIHVFGKMMEDEPDFSLGWEHYVGDRPNVTLHPPVSYAESLELLKQSKISLNSSPLFKNGTHERVFASFACGAFPVTSHSYCLEEYFKENEELLFYHPGKWKELNSTLTPFLTDETARQEAVSKGRAKVMQHHTWDQRVDQLINEVTPLLTKIN